MNKSREIKFRIWNEELRTFYYVVFSPTMGFVWNINGKPSKFQEDLFQQYTGLKDKNGLEIYEGDIIKKESYNSLFAGGEGIGVVIFGTRGIRLSHNLNYFMEETGYRLEKIGNIYQNPELLNGRKQ